MKRASGILLPVFSLPSKYGIGCFSKEAYKFIDLLKKAGQSYWQILPLADWLWGFPIPVFLHVCRQSLLHRPENTGERGASDQKRVQGI